MAAWGILGSSEVNLCKMQSLHNVCNVSMPGTIIVRRNPDLEGKLFIATLGGLNQTLSQLLR